jgi:hypothetical protein
MDNRFLTPLRGNGGAGSGSWSTPAPVDANAAYDDLIKTTRSGAGAQDAIDQYTSSAIGNAMPSFQKELQLTREDGVRRGISTGDLGTSFEGDLASAFQRNTANAVAGQATQLYESGQNRYADLLSGKLDRQTAQENMNRKKKGGLFGGIGSVLGGIAGGIFGGPAGAAAGRAGGRRDRHRLRRVLRWAASRRRSSPSTPAATWARSSRRPSPATRTPSSPSARRRTSTTSRAAPTSPTAAATAAPRRARCRRRCSTRRCRDRSPARSTSCRAATAPPCRRA